MFSIKTTENTQTINNLDLIKKILHFKITDRVKRKSMNWGKKISHLPLRQKTSIYDIQIIKKIRLSLIFKDHIYVIKKIALTIRETDPSL